MEYTIRRLEVADVPEYLALANYINHETDFFGTDASDPQPSMMQMMSAVKNGRQIAFIAETENGMVGHFGAFWRRGTGKKLKHCMTVGLGVAKDFWGNGIGNALFVAYEAWAKENGVERIELEVMVHNEAAIALYKKRGFEIEGTKKHSIKKGDEFIDEYMMAKLL